MKRLRQLPRQMFVNLFLAGSLAGRGYRSYLVVTPLAKIELILKFKLQHKNIVELAGGFLASSMPSEVVISTF